MRIVKIVAMLAAGKPLTEDDLNEVLLMVRGQVNMLADRDQIEQGVIDLATAALVPGVRVVELNAQPKMMDGKKIRCIAIIG